MTAGPSAAGAADIALGFGELLLGMDYADAALRPLLDLEGLKEWRPPRLSGYDQLERAVDEAGFYDARRRDHRRRLPAVGTAPWTESPCRALTPLPPPVDLADLGLDEGGHLLVARALGAARARRAADGDRAHPALRLHLGAWCREHGHRVAGDAVAGAAGRRWRPRMTVIVKGGSRRPPLAGRGAGRRRGRAARRRGPTPGLGPGRARRARRGGRAADRRPTGPSASTSGPTSRRSCTRPRPPASGTRRPPSTGPRPIDASRRRSSAPSSSS